VIAIAEPTIFVPQDTGGVGQELNDCESRLLGLSAVPYTDISGAIKYASLALQGGENVSKTIVMFTDLEEDLPPGQEPAVADLSSVCVAVFYEITGHVPSKPRELDVRIREWRARFESWGAAGTLFRHAAAFSSSDLARFVGGCKK